MIDIHELYAGYRFPSRTKAVSQERMTKYIDSRFSALADRRVQSGKNIHTDAEYARSRGLQGAVADGIIATAWLSTWMTEIFGVGYLKGGKIATKYVRPVYAGDELTLEATVKQKLSQSSGERLTMDLACKNQRGETVVVGTASALVIRPDIQAAAQSPLT